MHSDVLIIGDAGSVHFRRWVSYLQRIGYRPTVVAKQSPTRIDTAMDYSGCGLVHDWRGAFRRRFSFIMDFFRVNSPRYLFVNLHYYGVKFALYSLARIGPTVLTCWGTDILGNYRNSTGLSRWVMRLGLRRAYRVTCDSEEVREVLAEGSRAIEAKTRIVYWGVDTARFTHSSQERIAAREKFGIPVNAVVLLSVRLMAPKYRIREILRWFRGSIVGSGVILFVQAVPDVDPEYFATCEMEARGIPNIVFHAEKVESRDMPALYHLADIDIHHPIHDATPVSMLEGIACGNMILARGGIPAYGALARDYFLEFYDSLEDVTAARIHEIARRRLQCAGANRARLLELHSEERTVADLRETLAGVPAAPASPEGIPLRRPERN